MKKRDTMKFPILGVIPPDGQRWKIGQEEVNRLIGLDRIEIVDGKVKIAIYPEDEQGDILKPFWSHQIDTGSAEDGKKLLNSLFEEKLGFDTVKPIDLIKKLVFASTPEGAKVLDFFGGSATTAHAVMDLNTEDNKTRNFIIVQIPEDISENSNSFSLGFDTIDQISRERIRLAAKKLQEEYPEAVGKVDFGFKAFKLSESNFKNVSRTPNDYDQTSLFESVSNIREDRSDMDLLFEVILALGMELSVNVKKEGYSDSILYDVDDSSLIACFTENINSDTIRYIASKEPLRVVFKDGSFKDSASKINLEEIFKELSPLTRIKVV